MSVWMTCSLNLDHKPEAAIFLKWRFWGLSWLSEKLETLVPSCGALEEKKTKTLARNLGIIRLLCGLKFRS